MGTRLVKLLKILIKIGIMFLVMTGLILINRKFINNANGSEKEGRKTSLEIAVKPFITICNQEEIDRPYTSNLPADMYYLSERTGRT